MTAALVLSQSRRLQPAILPGPSYAPSSDLDNSRSYGAKGCAMLICTASRALLSPCNRYHIACRTVIMGAAPPVCLRKITYWLPEHFSSPSGRGADVERAFPVLFGFACSGISTFNDSSMAGCRGYAVRRIVGGVSPNGTVWTSDDEAKAGLREGCQQRVRTIAVPAPDVADLDHFAGVHKVPLGARRPPAPHRRRTTRRSCPAGAPPRPATLPRLAPVRPATGREPAGARG